MSNGLGKSIRCDGCDKSLSDYHGRQHPGEVMCGSLVYGASEEIVLCKRCSQREDMEVEKHGTNDLPHLLKLYQSPQYNK